MRLLLPLLTLATLWACDPYLDVQKADTVEAYEAYLAEHPTGTNAFRAQVRLEELVLARAREQRTPEAYDAFLSRFGSTSVHADAARQEREDALFDHAGATGTVEAWEAFVADYPNAGKGRAAKARKALEAARYAPFLKPTEVRVTKINLAEDPEGPLDGTGFEADFTNTGDKVVAYYQVRIHYLDAQGRSLGAREWPLVAPYRDYPVPVEEALTVPMAPGETRTWSWASGNLPEGFAGRARLEPVEIRFFEPG